MKIKNSLKQALSKIERELTSMSPDALGRMLDARTVGDVGNFYLDTHPDAQFLPIAMEVTSGSIASPEKIGNLGLEFGIADSNSLQTPNEFRTDDGDFGSEAA